MGTGTFFDGILLVLMAVCILWGFFSGFCAILAGIVSVLGGLLCAVYGAPHLCGILGISSGLGVGIINVLLFLIGTSILSVILEYIRKKLMPGWPPLWDMLMGMVASGVFGVVLCLLVTWCLTYSESLRPMIVRSYSSPVLIKTVEFFKWSLVRYEMEQGYTSERTHQFLDSFHARLISNKEDEKAESSDSSIKASSIQTAPSELSGP